jgi:hypothetical protein
VISPLFASLLALVIILSGAFGGMMLRKVLPDRHLADDTKDAVRLGTGLIGTIAALVLGLLIAAANSSFDTQRGHVQHVAADIILLDQFWRNMAPKHSRLARDFGKQSVPWSSGSGERTDRRTPLNHPSKRRDLARMSQQ